MSLKDCERKFVLYPYYDKDAVDDFILELEARQNTSSVEVLNLIKDSVSPEMFIQAKHILNFSDKRFIVIHNIDWDNWSVYDKLKMKDYERCYSRDSAEIQCDKYNQLCEEK